MTYCCEMREHYGLAMVVRQRGGVAAPLCLADFIIKWEPKIVIRIKFCPFCGHEMTDDDPVMEST